MIAFMVRGGWMCVATALALLTPSRSAHAQSSTAEQCVAAHVEGQLARNNGRLTRAKAELLVCAAADCPGPIRSECSDLLRDLGTSIPSVVVVARGAGNEDIAGATVSVDGATPVRIDGRPVEVDPGEHTFSCRIRLGVIVEAQAIVASGEQRRLIICRFANVPAPASTEDRSASSSPAIAAPRVWPWTAWALLGVGAAAGGAAGYFYGSALARDSELRDRCAPACSESVVDGVRSRHLWGDIMLGASLLALGSATFVVLTTKAKSGATSAVRVSGGSLLISRTF